MKLLLDECIPEDLAEYIEGHEVHSVSSMGWKGVKNGELMRRTNQSGFDAFLTVDQNLEYQQNIKKYSMAIVVFDVRRNALSELKLKLPALYELLLRVEKSSVHHC